MIRALFKLASLLTTATILLSGNPKRIGGHAVRRSAFKGLGRWLR